MDSADSATQLVVGAVFLVVLYFIIRSCCPTWCQSEDAQSDVPDVIVERRCTCTGLISGVVTHVSDGDGFMFLHSCPGYTQFDDTLRVRLAGIDAPEMGKGQKPGQPFANEAKEYLKRLVLRKSLNLDKIRVDQYGRILAIAFLPVPTPVNVNLEMVRNGFACVYEGRDAAYGGFGEQLWKLQEQAMRAKKGMWSVPNVKTPMEYKGSKDFNSPLLLFDKALLFSDGLSSFIIATWPWKFDANSFNFFFFCCGTYTWKDDPAIVFGNTGSLTGCYTAGQAWNLWNLELRVVSME